MADEQLKREIDAYVDEVWEDVVADIASLVAVESVEDMAAAREGAPFGPGPREALDRALAMAARMGLDAHDLGGHAGYAELKGASERQLAFVEHLDVVPAGDGWRHGPFELVREDGCLVGRGVRDDKGPAVLSTYAVRFFREGGRTPSHTLRVVYGVNEETHMADMDYYLAHEPMPAFAIVPDTEFPVCYGEKGCYWADVASAPLGPDARIVEASGGIVANAVPDSAYAVVRADAAALPAAERIKVEPAGEGLARVEAAGVAAHASKPQGSVNAILVLVDYLRAHGIASPEERAFLDLEHE
ncbi:MAG: Sapep family Mn(2+)-dependent dipeptidase, partial [Atopobiaceae bacterium]|nr:Sapep family Mn(2+)-dependent dipeptidase [Atopobiaceae bacterium]